MLCFAAAMRDSVAKTVNRDCFTAFMPPGSVADSGKRTSAFLVASRWFTELKAIRDQARADTERAEGAIDRLGPTITTQSIKSFARTARKRMRTESGGYRRDYLRALAQRVEVDAQELRVMGSRSELLRTLVAASSARTAGFGVPSSVPKWRTRHDSNV